MFRLLLTTCLLIGILPFVKAQDLPVIVEAESGTAGSDWQITTSSGVTYVSPKTDLANGGYPGNASKVITYTVTFPKAGVYDLYAKISVGAAGANDDSYYYAKGFGAKNAAADNNEWVTCNNLFSKGYIYLEPPVVVEAAGNGGTEIWKWINISEFNGGETPVTFTVPDGNLTQTFQIGARENGLQIDKFVFGLSAKYFTVKNLSNGEAGIDTKPSPIVPTGNPIASGKPKYIGQVYSGSESQTPYFANYWNQVAPGNGGKWGTIEGTRDVMNWTECDNGLKLATDNGFPFRFHVLVWGRQQPAWMASLPPAEQLDEIKEWFQAVATRYPNLEMVEVVNEPTHAPPTTGGADYGNYKEALGGDGTTGWDWVLNAFRMARQYFPAGTKLMLNEYHLENNGTTRAKFIQIVNLLKAENLIDAIGTQAHSFSTTGSAASIKAALDELAATGIPIYVTEFDLDGINTTTKELDDLLQVDNYKRVFPVFWEHPMVKGITFHGWRVGQWRTNEGAFLIYSDNSERPALQWLRNYVENYAQPPLVDSSSFYTSVKTIVNPLLAGDHPDPTLLKVGNDFYMCGSVFHFTPYLPILHSKDLVHWEEISRVVPANWNSLISDAPGRGIWQGAITYFYGSYRIYFSNGSGGGQYFSKAATPWGPWSAPVKLTGTTATGNTGYDNSVFVDDDGTPYLLIKAGRNVNRIQQIGTDGHLTGTTLNLDWVNTNNRYSWAEGPVMCKRNGWYYYFVAGNVGGGQYVLRSRTLTADSTQWEAMGNFFAPTTASATFRSPNHMSAPFQLADGTWWTLAQSYEKQGTNDWSGQGRQGVLHSITWDANGKPTGHAPTGSPFLKPVLSNDAQLPWKLPRSDYFDNSTLKLSWHFLNKTAAAAYSLSDRNGWLRIDPGTARSHILQKEGGHYYTLVTRVDVDAATPGQEAGIYVTNGNESLVVKLFSGNAGGKKIIFTMGAVSYQVNNTIGKTLWLKLDRKEHDLYGYYSADGISWTQVGSAISAVNLDKGQPDYNSWVGNSIGLYAEAIKADFDLFLYRDGFSPLPVAGYNNFFGVQTTAASVGKVVTNASDYGGWLMIGGVDLGNNQKTAQKIEVSAAAVTGGNLEVWMDGLGTGGTRIATLPITGTGGVNTWKTFSTDISGITGQHDIYLVFPAVKNAFYLNTIRFSGSTTITDVTDSFPAMDNNIKVNPNPVNDNINISLGAAASQVRGIDIIDVTGRLVLQKTVNGESTIQVAAGNLLPGIYFIKIRGRKDMTFKVMKQ